MRGGHYTCFNFPSSGTTRIRGAPTCAPFCHVPCAGGWIKAKTAKPWVLTMSGTTKTTFAAHVTTVELFEKANSGKQTKAVS